MKPLILQDTSNGSNETDYGNDCSNQLRQCVCSSIKSVVSQQDLFQSQSPKINDLSSLLSLAQNLRMEVKQYKSLYQEQRGKYEKIVKVSQAFEEIGKTQKFQQLEKQLKDTYENRNNNYQNQLRQIQRKSIIQQNQLQEQLSISKKKLQIVERNRILLQQQISILKQQLSSKDSKISCLSNQLLTVQSKLAIKSSTQIEINNDELKRMELIVHQHKQTVEAHKSQLMRLCQENKKIVSLNQQLRQLLKSQKQMHEQTRETSLNEIQYYQGQQQKLRKVCKQLQSKVESLQKTNIKSLEQTNQKWAKITEQFLKRVQVLETEIYQSKKEKQLLQKSINKHLHKYQKFKEENQAIKLQNAWQKQLLQQAKGEIIASQLIKEKTIQKFTKQNKELKKRHQMYNFNFNRTRKQSFESADISCNSSFYGNLSNKHSSNSLSPSPHLNRKNTNDGKKITDIFVNYQSQQIKRDICPQEDDKPNNLSSLNIDHNESYQRQHLKSPLDNSRLKNDKERKNEIKSRQFFSKIMESINNNRNNSQITKPRDLSNNKVPQYNTIKSIKSNRTIKTVSNQVPNQSKQAAFSRKNSAHYDQINGVLISTQNSKNKENISIESNHSRFQFKRHC